MTLDHGIIRDLLPLYADGVCGEESKKAVEAHLAECPQCREEYEKLKNSGTFGADPGRLEDKKAAALKKVRRALSWKRVAAVCLAVVVTLAALTGAGMWMNSATVRMPADVVKSVEYLPDNEAGLEAFNQATRESLEKAGHGEAYHPWPTEDFSGGLHFTLEGKYADFGLGFYGMRRAGGSYVLVVSVRVTYWDALFHRHPQQEYSNILVPSSWKYWKDSILSQYFGVEAIQSSVAEELQDEMEKQVPPPVDEDCIFDEVYFFPNEKDALVFVEGRDPNDLEALLESQIASGDAVLIWERDQ